MFRHILVATDLGPGSQPALDLAVEMAQRDSADLFLIHVFEVPAYVYPGAVFTPIDCLGPLQEEAERRLHAVLAGVRERWPRAQALFKVGNPWERIVAALGDVHADLVVTGTHGRRGIAHALLGSVAEKVVRLSPVPVLTVRQPNEASDPQ